MTTIDIEVGSPLKALGYIIPVNGIAKIKQKQKLRHKRMAENANNMTRNTNKTKMLNESSKADRKSKKLGK